MAVVSFVFWHGRNLKPGPAANIGRFIPLQRGRA